MEAGAISLRSGREVLSRPLRARLADPIFKWVLRILAALVLVLIVFFFVFLYNKAHVALSKFGVFGFTFGETWDVGKEQFHVLPMLVGTLITAGIALIIGVPVAVAAAVFVTELCPQRLRGPLTILVDLLAAVPSVVYGLWAFVILVPHLEGVENWFGSTLSFIPFIGGGTPTPGPNYLISGLVLAIMIVPIVSAISREVMATVPSDHKEAALALGMTRWEMIRTAVLPYSRSGITGAAMLGLGRAVGETIAVAFVIGGSTTIGHHILSQGYTLAAIIANEFQEAANDKLHSGALVAAGLVLFVMTLVINAFARAYVRRAERRNMAPPPVPETGDAVTLAAMAS
jgi:phosphate ABC transporter permease protein PstC